MVEVVASVIVVCGPIQAGNAGEIIIRVANSIGNRSLLGLSLLLVLLHWSRLAAFAVVSRLPLFAFLSRLTVGFVLLGALLGLVPLLCFALSIDIGVLSWLIAVSVPIRGAIASFLSVVLILVLSLAVACRLF